MIIELDKIRDEYNAINALSYESLIPFMRGYFDAAIWSIEDVDLVLDTESLFEQIVPRTKKKMIKECNDFIISNNFIPEVNTDLAGHSFLLTRGGGVGYFRGPFAQQLEESARKYPPFELIVDKVDNKIKHKVK